MQCSAKKYDSAYYHINNNKNLTKRRLFPNSMQCYQIKTVFLSSEILKRAKYFASEEKALNVSCDLGQNRDPLANSQFE